MARAATSRLKINLPALQWALVSQLQVDSEYQRSVDSGPSQTLIRKIAQHWNWDLCQPLIVSRRADSTMWVIDGQHRLCAAQMRGDIAQLPCVLVDYSSPADEAASFVHLNQQRRPLRKLDVFKAAVASEDPESCAILAALEEAGLTLAPHSNHTTWKPGMVANIGGLESAWREHGPAPTRMALLVLAAAFKDKVLQYAGTLFPGIVGICAQDGADCEIGILADMLAQRSQKDWRGAIMRARADNPNLRYAAAARCAGIRNGQFHLGGIDGVLRQEWPWAAGRCPS